jgi:hypothetical protein
MDRYGAAALVSERPAKLLGYFLGVESSAFQIVRLIAALRVRWSFAGG